MAHCREMAHVCDIKTSFKPLNNRSHTCAIARTLTVSAHSTHTRCHPPNPMTEPFLAIFRGKSKGKGKASKKKALRLEQEGAEGEEGDEEEEDSGDEDDDDDEEEEEEDGANLTAHTEHSRRMKGKITDQERELLAEKPWALRGEVHSHDRPQNR